MEAKNDLILEQINEFVDQNIPNLTRVKKENPDLFGVVSDTLSFLRKRYGGESVNINEVIKVEEQPKIQVPETNLSEIKVSEPKKAAKPKVSATLKRIDALEKAIKEIEDYIQQGIIEEDDETKGELNILRKDLAQLKSNI